MNCDQFRLRALSDPHRLDPEAIDHVSRCETCARALSRAHRNNAAVADAIQAVRHPALVDRLLMIPQSAARSRQRKKKWKYAALAASACMAITIFVARHYIEPVDANGWAELILDHMEENRDEFYAAGTQSNEEQLRLLGELGVSLNGSGELRAIRSDRCKMKRTAAVHTMVEAGDVQGVVFFLPKNVGVAEVATADHFAVLATRDDRTVAVIGRNRKETSHILRSLDRYEFAKPL